jgi:hypothetical protein
LGPVRPLRKIEKWSNIIRKLGLDVNKPVNYITARQIKNSSGEEPRLMAKMDTVEELPQVFHDNSLFLLPVNRQGYVIVKGEGYHQLERVPDPVKIHRTSLPFPISCSDVTSERVYLDYAFSSGLLARVTGVDNLNISFGDKRTTPSFSFNVNSSSITVDRAQIEIDAVYENREEIVIVEAKIGIPDTFNIKQLYYPLRTLYGRKKRIRNFFFCFEPDSKLYLFWEYRFRSYQDFQSIELIKCNQFKMEISEIISTKDYRMIKPTIKSDIPQANDVNKIIQFPYRVFDGYNTSRKMTDAFCFVERQSSYYRQAAEVLGLVTTNNKKYRITPTGEKLLSLPAEQKSKFVCKLLLGFTIMNEIFLQISVDHNKVITRQDIINILKYRSQLTGDTLARRAQTILAWFRWIRNNLGMVEIERNGNIRLARQMRLF